MERSKPTSRTADCARPPAGSMLPMTLPSAGESNSFFVPTVPPAPGRLTTLTSLTPWPSSFFCSFGASTRADVPVPPPSPKGTIQVTLAGSFWAPALEPTSRHRSIAAAVAPATAKDFLKFVLLFMVHLPGKLAKPELRTFKLSSHLTHLPCLRALHTRRGYHRSPVLCNFRGRTAMRRGPKRQPHPASSSVRKTRGAPDRPCHEIARQCVSRIRKWQRAPKPSFPRKAVPRLLVRGEIGANTPNRDATLPNRHSRESGNPGAVGAQQACLPRPTPPVIPAFAGMTEGTRE